MTPLATPIAVLLLVAVGAALVTALVRRYALRRALLDVPNERSSHTEPTPRAGGLGIVVAVLAGLAAGAALGWLAPRVFAAVAGGGILVAGIGLLDDHRHVAAPVRVAVHFAAAVFALTVLGGIPVFAIGPHLVRLGTAGWILGALGIVWLINLYNFMDGIDGIAAGEAVTVGIGGAVLAVLLDAPGIAFAAAVVAAATAGFLPWNWAPARIFMGDVGSGFLGYTLIVLALASERAGGPPLAIWLLLLGVFVVDATVTLGRRVVRGERWSMPHRSHAYQLAVQSGFPHSRVTTAVLIVNAGLFLLALTALANPAWSLAVLALAVLALIALRAIVVRRGVRGLRNGGRPA